MRTAPEALQTFEENGGKVWLEGGKVKVKYPEKSRQQLAPTLDYLRNHRQEIAAFLDQRVKSLPPDHTGLKQDSNHHDPYRQNMERALEQISRRSYHPETMNWLRNSQPLLYRKLMVELPREIDRLWLGKAPLQEFHKLLDLWIQTHEQCCALFESQVEATSRGRP